MKFLPFPECLQQHEDGERTIQMEPFVVPSSLLTNASVAVTIPSVDINNNRKPRKGKKRGAHSSSAERRDRSRERNRVHAQKTRQRKKEQMNILKKQAAELKEEQLRLRQTINEKATATILVCLFAELGSVVTSSASPSTSASGSCSLDEDPIVEALLRRPLEDVPDPSKIPELPALILPGQHASKKMRANRLGLHVSCNAQPSAEHQKQEHRLLQNSSDESGGIDSELLGRDRSRCSPEELDLIRRERNRMHAKRTRDRKRLYTEQLGQVCRQLSEENDLLHQHLHKLDPNHVVPERPASLTVVISTQSSPKVSPSQRSIRRTESVTSISLNPSAASKPSTSVQLQFDQQISTLLMAAASDLNEVSDGASSCGEPQRKRARF